MASQNPHSHLYACKFSKKIPNLMCSSCSSSYHNPSSMASSSPIKTTSKVTKSITEKKPSKGSSSSTSPEPFLRDTIQLFSLNPMDYDESIRVMIEFIAHHPISIPLTKVPETALPLHLLHTTFTRIKIDNDVLEFKITGDRICQSTN